MTEQERLETEIALIDRMKDGLKHAQLSGTAEDARAFILRHMEAMRTISAMALGHKPLRAN